MADITVRFLTTIKRSHRSRILGDLTGQVTSQEQWLNRSSHHGGHSLTHKQYKSSFKPAHIYCASKVIVLFHEQKKFKWRNMISKSC